MTVPSPVVNIQGIGSVTADNLNTFIQAPISFAQLRAVVGITGMVMFAQGVTGAGTASPGFFYWNPTGIAPDDNLNIIVPPAAAQGEWVRLAIGGGSGPSSFTAALVLDIDGLGGTPSTGIVRDMYVPFACTITTWVLQADQTGSIVIDVWKAPFMTNTPPTVANTITGSALPTLSTAESALSSTLTGWTTAVSAGDWIRFNINSVATLTLCTLTLVVTG